MAGVRKMRCTFCGVEIFRSIIFRDLCFASLFLEASIYLESLVTQGGRKLWERDSSCLWAWDSGFIRFSF